jgi:hypothetical protein
MTQTLEVAAPPAAQAQPRAALPGRGRGAAWLVAGFCATLPFTVQFFRYGDEWWHIALGRLILAGGIPAVEPFSFVTAQHPWVDQQWLYEVLLATLVRIGGDPLASAVLGLVGSAAVLVAALTVPRAVRVPRGWSAAAMLLGAVMAADVLGVRGETVSALGVALTLLIIRRWRDGSQRAVWLLPPLFLLWANLHAGFVAGLAILAFTLVIHRPRLAGPPSMAISERTALVVIGVGAAVAGLLGGLVVGAGALVVLWAGFRPVAPDPGARRRPLLVASLIAAAATLANPAGPGLYGYIAETLGNPILSQLVSEWQSPNFHDTLTKLIEVTAALLPLLWVLSRRVRIPDALLATVMLLATLQAVRNVSLFALVAIPLLAEHGAAAWALRAPEGLRRRLTLRASPAVAAIACLAVGGASLAVVAPNLTPAAAARWQATNLPESAADYVAVHFPGQRLLSTDTDAGYLAYRFPTGRVVFVYDEIGIFGVGPLTAYRDVAILAPGWPAILSRYGVDHAILPATSDDASALLELGWTTDCYDPQSGRAVLSAGGAPPASAPPPPPTSAPHC